MSSKSKRIWASVGIFILLLAILGGLAGNRMVKASFPQTDGEIKLAGLQGPVRVTRDKMGIPHIYATTMHDMFMAQGFIHAQDRFWQMDFWRHIGSGRLAEMFGKSQVETDSFLRTLGWRQIAEQEFASLDPESVTILTSYAEGVNAYLKDHSGSALSLEYAILGVLTPSYKPEPWTPINTLTWGKAMAWDLRGNLGEEIERAVLSKTLKPDQVAELYPPYPGDHPTIIQDFGNSTTSALASKVNGHPFVSPASELPTSSLDFVSRRIGSLDGVLGPSGPSIGSNSWAVSGKLTTSGKPLLANDPHLSIQMPSIWYQVDMHCQPASAACPYEIAGFSFAGVPGVVIGHNARISWGFTNVEPDVMDLYVEKINPQNSDQYEYMGKWVDMDVHTETIQVGGGKPIELRVRTTRHGPVISDTYGPLKDKVTPTVTPFKDLAGIPLPENYAISLRWTALEPGTVFKAIWGFDKAQNWDQFRESAKYFTVPPQNLLYADVDGNIGYQMPGNFPIRSKGDGRLPVPGWTGEYEWTGYIPFDELPYEFNPPSGYIVAANNQIPLASYKYLISTDWDYGFRAQRILEMIQQAPGKIDSAYFQKIQGDDKSLNAEVMIKILNGIKLEPSLAKIRDQYLSNWDYQETMDSSSAALYESFWWSLEGLTFFDENIPVDYMPGDGSRGFMIMENLVKQPDSPWWDDKSTPDKVETRDDIFIKAFESAVKCDMWCQITGGGDWSARKWGKLHSATFRNSTLGKSGIAPIEMLFNRGPFQTSGGDAIVNATGWDMYNSFEVNWVPSMRMIVDLSNLNNSLTVHTTGESGHAYHPHYIDMADLWRNIQYYPMWWDPDSVKRDAESTLNLVP
ncbi:MAG TPA: penicillin acylase family protein [Anaerolineales bacterium]|jgi:penicillin amidase